jgi:hypothetical protein
MALTSSRARDINPAVDSSVQHDVLMSWVTSTLCRSNVINDAATLPQ